MQGSRRSPPRPPFARPVEPGGAASSPPTVSTSGRVAAGRPASRGSSPWRTVLSSRSRVPWSGGTSSSRGLKATRAQLENTPDGARLAIVLLTDGEDFSHGVGRYSDFPQDDTHDYCRAAQESAPGVLACRNSCDDIAEIVLGNRRAGRNLRARKALGSLYGRLIVEMRCAGFWAADGGTPLISDRDPSRWIEGCAQLFVRRNRLHSQIRELSDQF